MPLYDYICNECKLKISVFHSMDSPVPQCAECSQDLRKVFKNNKDLLYKTKKISTPKLRIEKFIKDAKIDLKNQTKAHRGKTLDD
jgi:putative FmdB family regulatory protein